MWIGAGLTFNNKNNKDDDTLNYHLWYLVVITPQTGLVSERQAEKEAQVLPNTVQCHAVMSLPIIKTQMIMSISPVRQQRETYSQLSHSCLSVQACSDFF